MKHLAFQIEKTHRRKRPQQLVAQVGGKGIITKGKKTGKRSEEYSDTTNTTSRTTSHAPSDNNCIKIHAKQNSSARRVRPSKLVITITQIKHRYTNKTLEIR